MERPILFSTEMVKALLEGGKTQTRRLVKPQPIDARKIDGNFYEGRHRGYVKVDGHPCWQKQFVREFAPWQVKDILWVRENFRVNAWVPDDGELAFRYEADGETTSFIQLSNDDDGEKFNRYWIQSCDDLAKAGYKVNEEECYEDYKYDALRLRPSIHMPKSAARIFLEITDIKVERLQDISEEDAKAEGIMRDEMGYRNYDKELQKQYGDPSVDFPHFIEPYDSFASLWISINGEQSWNDDPWCWAITFKILSTTGLPTTTGGARGIK